MQMGQRQVQRNVQVGESGVYHVCLAGRPFAVLLLGLLNSLFATCGNGKILLDVGCRLMHGVRGFGPWLCRSSGWR